MYLRHEILDRWETRLTHLHRPYTKIMYGSSVVLQYGERKAYFVGSIGDEKLQGIHIVNLFKQHLLKNIDNLSYDPSIKDSDLIYVWFSHDNLPKLTKKQVGIMDINNCYFETARLMGYVDDRLYQNANKKDREYKLARNIAIGALNTSKIICQYDENGNQLSRKSVRPDKRLSAIRRNIINFVGQFSLAAYREFPEDIFMYQTDCFYYNRRIEKKLRNFIYDHGHTTKMWAGDLIRHSVSERTGHNVIVIWDYKAADFKKYKMNSLNEVNVCSNNSKK